MASASALPIRQSFSRHKRLLVLVQQSSRQWRRCIPFSRVFSSNSDAWAQHRRRQLPPSLQGQLAAVEFHPFGSIQVTHADILETTADAILLPMTPNLCPYRGLGLEAFERLGADVVKSVYEKAKETWWIDYEEGRGGNSEKDAKPPTELPTENLDQVGLKTGSVVVVNPVVAGSPKSIIFVIMPWFWQGSPMDAAKRFRYCIKRGLLEASKACTSVALPNLGSGIFGYEPRSCSRIIVEESIEALLQIEARAPTYILRDIRLVDNRLETASQFQDALTDAAHRWLPEMRLTTAPQFWGRQTRRLLVLPAVSNFFLRRYPVKFKKHHDVKRKWRQHWLGNIKSRLWRPQKVNQPPPLLVHEASGEVAPKGRQLKPRPFYYRGVSHWLFPTRQKEFHMLRRSSKGHWVGRAERFRIGEYTRPRL